MIRKGMLKSFDSSAYTASVRIVGSLSVWLDSVKVSEALAAVDMVAGRSVAVLFLDPSNPDEAIVIGLWGVASLSISDTAYNATSWNAVTDVAASKNAIRDKLEAGVTPSAHKASHENTGGDEISVAALSGLLADDQHVLDAEVKAAAVSDVAYDATTWNGVTDVAPSKNAVRDKIEALPAPTKEFFIPCHYGGTEGATEYMFGWHIDAANERAYVHFMVPQDFTAISNAEVVIQAAATNASMDFTILTYYGAAGEAYDTHSADCSTAIATTEWRRHAIDISSGLASLAVGDYVMVKVEYDTDTDAYIFGIRLKYT